MTIFSVREVKPGLKYRIVDGGPDRFKGVRIFSDKNNARDENGAYQSDKAQNTYDQTNFTLVYPSSVEEAAKILDAYQPGWETKVKNINQMLLNTCVLGQLYGDWRQALSVLFNITLPTDYYAAEYKKYAGDTIFGDAASRSEWEGQISLRLKKVEPIMKQNTMTFGEAMTALTQGKKIQGSGWAKGQYLYLEKDILKWGYDNSNYIGTVFGFANFVFHIYEEPKLTFGELKAGDKFTHCDGPVWIKAEDVPYAVGASNPLAVYKLNNTDIVKKVG